MTHDEIKAMVCELFEFGEDKWFDYADSFIKLVEDSVTAEREACAKVCDEACVGDFSAMDKAHIQCANRIRTRSNAM